jgi:hypothetical protein
MAISRYGEMETTRAAREAWESSVLAANHGEGGLAHDVWIVAFCAGADWGREHPLQDWQRKHTEPGRITP